MTVTRIPSLGQSGLGLVTRTESSRSLAFGQLYERPAAYPLFNPRPQLRQTYPNMTANGCANVLANIYMCFGAELLGCKEKI